MIATKRRIRRGIVAVAGTGAMLAALAAPAFAVSPSTTSSTSATGTQNLAVQPGTLTVTSVLPGTIDGQIGLSANGALPSAKWGDTTGSGAGWNGTLALSDFTYTGTWAAVGSAPALTSTASAPFKGFSDGVTYTVKAASSTTFTYTSSDPNDQSSSAAITMTPGTAQAVGTKGLTINFSSSATYAAGDTYVLQAGVQTPGALSLDTAATAASITADSGTTSPDPTFANNSVAVAGDLSSASGASNTALGSAVKVLSAAVGSGMGYYTVVPGATVAVDVNSFAQTYTANAEYSIVTGP